MTTLTELEAANVEIENLKDRLDELQRENDDLQSENERLEKERDKLQDENEELEKYRAECTDLKDELEELKDNQYGYFEEYATPRGRITIRTENLGDYEKIQSFIENNLL